MSNAPVDLTPRERELGAIILQYNQVTERLKASHEQLLAEVSRLREELAHKNRELERRERLAALGHMAAGLAHEIRNPLGGIQLYASLLARDLTGSPKQFQVVEKISRAVVLLDGLVGDVLTFAHPSEPQRETVTLGTVADEVIELISPQLHRNDVELRVDDDCYRAELHVDPRQLQQVLLNVLLNAVEAATDRAGSDGEAPGADSGTPWVHLSVRRGARVDEDAVLTITDSGPGIDAESLHRVFNPFFTTKETGTGLGLAIVHQLVEAHGGSITAGRHAGGGAMFTIRLPGCVARSVA